MSKKSSRNLISKHSTQRATVENLLSFTFATTHLSYCVMDATLFWKRVYMS